MARLSNLQMRALNDSMSNLLNTGLEQIHKRLDELQTNRQTRSQTGARRDRPRRHSRSDHDIHEEESHDDDENPSTDLGEVLETKIKVMSIHLVQMIELIMVWVD